MKLDNRLILILIAVIGIYAIFLFVSDYNIISEKIFNFKIEYIPIILLIVPCSWLALYSRWILLLKKNKIQLPYKENFLIYFAGFALVVSPGKSGELLKSILMKNKFNIPPSSSVPIILVERLYDLIGAVLAAFLGIWFLGTEFFLIIIVAIIILIIVFSAIFSQQFFKLILNLLEKIRFLERITKSLPASIDIIKNLAKGRIVIISSLLTMGYWILESLALYFVLLGFGIDSIYFLNLVTTYALSLFIGAISLIPGGVGVTEGSLVGLLSIQGIEITMALVVVVLTRIFTLWYSVIVGFIALKLSGGLDNSLQPN